MRKALCELALLRAASRFLYFTFLTFLLAAIRHRKIFWFCLRLGCLHWDPIPNGPHKPCQPLLISFSWLLAPCLLSWSKEFVGQGFEQKTATVQVEHSTAFNDMYSKVMRHSSRQVWQNLFRTQAWRSNQNLLGTCQKQEEGLEAGHSSKGLRGFGKLFDQGLDSLLHSLEAILVHQPLRLVLLQGFGVLFHFGGIHGRSSVHCRTQGIHPSFHLLQPIKWQQLDFWLPGDLSANSDKNAILCQAWPSYFETSLCARTTPPLRTKHAPGKTCIALFKSSAIEIRIWSCTLVLLLIANPSVASWITLKDPFFFYRAPKQATEMAPILSLHLPLWFLS